jgi:nicotinate-nucleotide adenylyltransferase
MREHIGLFGGTFDPPHIAHLVIASEARFQMKLDRVFWVLIPNPPHNLSQTITALAAITAPFWGNLSRR